MTNVKLLIQVMASQDLQNACQLQTATLKKLPQAYNVPYRKAATAEASRPALSFTEMVVSVSRPSSCRPMDATRVVNQRGCAAALLRRPVPSCQKEEEGKKKKDFTSFGQQDQQGQ